MDLSSQRQYLQKAINVKYSFAATTQQTIYTAPTGDDFDFAIVKDFIACDHGNQQTNLDVSITDTSSNDFFIYKEPKQNSLGNKNGPDVSLLLKKQ